ncbi:hypothetical protein JOB18_049534 [Solea senegalensis]|uniref:Uncharacterized protein n=1 Tax=Solea senegalensis TaxID=28829 RepID=A0AAV6SQ41_SOLSE|nr:hypothetical protein JOB18_049534 [Solea senegalensis]
MIRVLTLRLRVESVSERGHLELLPHVSTISTFRSLHRVPPHVRPPRITRGSGSESITIVLIVIVIIDEIYKGARPRGRSVSVWTSAVVHGSRTQNELGINMDVHQAPCPRPPCLSLCAATARRVPETSFSSTAASGRRAKVINKHPQMVHRRDLATLTTRIKLLLSGVSANSGNSRTRNLRKTPIKW